jgi:hypothetical protein
MAVDHLHDPKSSQRPLPLPAPIVRANLSIGNVVVLSEVLDSSGRTIEMLSAIWEKLECRGQLRVLLEWPEVNLINVADDSSEKNNERALAIQRGVWRWCKQSDKNVVCESAVPRRPPDALFYNPGNNFDRCKYHWSTLYGHVRALKVAEPDAKIVVITSPWSGCGKAIQVLTTHSPRISVCTVLLQSGKPVSMASGVGNHVQYTLKY